MTNKSIESSINCSVCGHPKKDHLPHEHKDHRNKTVVTISCRHTIGQADSMDMGIFGNVAITHSCSCHGVKPNTYLKRAVTKYSKFIKENKEKLSSYKVSEIRERLRYFRKKIRENPENKLWWQMTKPEWG